MPHKKEAKTVPGVFAVVPASESQKSNRKNPKEEKFKGTDAWRAFCLALGTHKRDKALQFSFSDEMYQFFNLSTRREKGRNVANGSKTIMRYIEGHLQEIGILNRYEIERRHENGIDLITVIRRPRK